MEVVGERGGERGERGALLLESTADVVMARGRARVAGCACELDMCSGWVSGFGFRVSGFGFRFFGFSDDKKMMFRFRLKGLECVG